MYKHFYRLKVEESADAGDVFELEAAGGGKAWMCGRKERAESKVTPRQRTWLTRESGQPLIVIDRSVGGGGEQDGGKMMNSVLSMLSFRKRGEKKEDMEDRHCGILDSKVVMSG